MKLTNLKGFLVGMLIFFTHPILAAQSDLLLDNLDTLKTNLTNAASPSSQLNSCQTIFSASASNVSEHQFCESLKLGLKKSYQEYLKRQSDFSTIIFPSTQSIGNPGVTNHQPVGYAAHMAPFILQFCPMGKPLVSKFPRTYNRGGKGYCTLPAHEKSLGALRGRTISVREAVETIFFKIHLQEGGVSEEEFRVLENFRKDISEVAIVGNKGVVSTTIDNFILYPGDLAALDDPKCPLSEKYLRIPYAGFGEINIFEDPILAIFSVGGTGVSALSRGRYLYKVGSEVSDFVATQMILRKSQLSVNSLRKLMGKKQLHYENYFNSTERSNGDWVVAAKNNRQALISTDTQRVVMAEQILDRSLSATEKAALLEAHHLLAINTDKQSKLLARSRILSQNNFSSFEIRQLLDHGLIGRTN